MTFPDIPTWVVSLMSSALTSLETTGRILAVGALVPLVVVGLPFLVLLLLDLVCADAIEPYMSTFATPLVGLYVGALYVAGCRIGRGCVRVGIAFGDRLLQLIDDAGETIAKMAQAESGAHQQPPASTCDVPPFYAQTGPPGPDLGIRRPVPREHSHG